MLDSSINPLRDLHASAAETMLPRRALTDHAERPGAATGERIAMPGVEYLTYGPPLEGTVPIEVPATFGSVELEYAALRRGCGVMDCPQRGTIRITGQERIDFLNRMVTQQLKDMQPGEGRCAFWLNRKGRIEADLLVLAAGQAMLIDLDLHDVQRTMESLSSYLFAEDVQIEDASSQYHRVALHGPQALRALFEAAGDMDAASDRTVDDLHGGSVTIDGGDVWFVRRDMIGEAGVELFVPVGSVQRVWRALLATKRPVDTPVCPVGWFAFNIARVEQGVPIMHIDFNQEHLPHESGILSERVSFTKGCYLGQEIVARMQSRGQPKQMIVGLKMQGDHQPLEGAPVFEQTDDGAFATPIGGVTSSAISPMLGGVPICLALVRTRFATTGTQLVVLAEGNPVSAVVAERPLYRRPPPTPVAG